MVGSRCAEYDYGRDHAIIVVTLQDWEELGNGKRRYHDANNQGV